MAYEQEIIIATMIISLISTMFVFTIYFICKPLQKLFAFKLVLYLNIAEIFWYVSRLAVLPDSPYFDSDNIWCKISGAMGNFSVQSELAWINIFNYCIEKVLVNNYSFKRL